MLTASVPARRAPKFSGIFADETAEDSYWIRECARLTLPPFEVTGPLIVQGELLAPDPADSTSHGEIGLIVRIDGSEVRRLAGIPEGAFTVEIPSIPAGAREVQLELTGTGAANFKAWLGRVTGLASWQPWRRQSLNRRLRIRQVRASGETVFDFSNRSSPWNYAFARKHLRLGLNVAGYFRAALGIGESARCMVRAADAASLPSAAVELKLPCKNPPSDDSFAPRLQPDTPHPVTVVHVDPPGMRDLQHHHGESFARGKHLVGYWAWELPDFPDAWMHYADYCHEVWAPSRFAADAIAAKVGIPVLPMPHAIGFERPQGDFRAKFQLPPDAFLFLFVYDLNSYSERKNPAAALEAFRRSGLGERGAGIVIKVQNPAGNEADLARLRSLAKSVRGSILITETLSRAAVYELMAACDCFVSLHRSEGFGLAVAECMYLGKPVIVTDWSATSEFVTGHNGFPVRYSLVTLDRNHGPYSRGQVWADPDLDHAAEGMRRLHDDRALARRLGASARADIERQFAPAVIGARYRRRLEAIAAW